MTPGRELVMPLRVEIAAALELGEIGHGFRRVIPITGDTFSGPGLRGEVVSGGARHALYAPSPPMSNHEANP